VAEVAENVIDELDIDQMNVEQDQVEVSNDASTDEDRDDLEALRPRMDVETWTIGKDDYERTYTQKPLSFFGKMEFFRLVGGVVDAALEAGTSVDAMLGGVTSGPRGSKLSADDFRQADQFVLVAAKLTEHAPDFLLDSFCIWLRVPEEDRYWVKQVMKEELNDEIALGIIETFVDQNVEEIEDFFTKQLPGVAKRVSLRRNEHKASSKQSKPLVPNGPRR
jgi:hypothetical protein